MCTYGRSSSNKRVTYIYPVVLFVAFTSPNRIGTLALVMGDMSRRL